MYIGYRIPHPLIFEVHVKVQTMDHRSTPVAVFTAALEDLKEETGILQTRFSVRNS